MKKRVKQGAIVPAPVLILGTYDEKGRPDAMNAAWGMMVETDVVGICLSREHKTVENIFALKEFTVSFGTKDTLAACDYVGLVSGNSEPDKIAKTGWKASKAPDVNAPLFEELPVTFECRFLSYDEETGILQGKIVGILADEKVLDGRGNVDLGKVEPIAYDGFSHRYNVLGEVVGQAFHDGLSLKK